MLRLLFWLFCALAFSAYGMELNVREREQILHSPQVDSQVKNLQHLLLSEQIDTLNFSLQRIAPPRQEAVRYLLLKNLEQDDVVLSLKMRQFVTEQQSINILYYVIKTGDGYKLSVPAFNFQATAHRLLQRWKQNESVSALVSQIEHHHFDLQLWLSGDGRLVHLHESLLIRGLSQLSDDAMMFLVRQLTDVPVTSWLPSSKFMAALVRESEDPKLYRLFWLMKADVYSHSELKRLSARMDASATAQVIAASRNPGLGQQAILILTRLNPMPADVKHFLIQQMSRDDTAEVTARALVEGGYSGWVEDLIETNQKIKRKILQRVVGVKID